MDYRIMIVEDDLSIAELLSSHISKYGYKSFLVKNFNNILVDFDEIDPHLVLLDVNLPKFDGYYWCRKIRQNSNCPIIFVSARGGEMEQVMGIESGGDDYITKPFYYEVLVAKIKSQLRRAYSSYATKSSERVVQLEGLTLYPERPEISYKDVSILITKKEAVLAEILISNYPRAVSRQLLLEKLWDDESFVEENTLNVNVARLRKRFEELGVDNAIETVRGVGYKIVITWRN
ncbi:two component transcriptional regulator, winged helix family [Gottschalkia acidurici 9a]|uniref:Two component transcriptional regulator, winged helix family n=1 Tax=Gottschalkia acidurici (strain ATCC 7906 / DSM 604 / BCRC 14475 / CIP 104303 / KCTC 5404 / NCIMB 10678 / 9a) TaxID=1128398 RepID=K0B2T3_GOTA9|nr:response regulator transcription factor [Gottschalkia acidurici]AFS78901.1 two component transcriptional regulator, winged helix family [Gottschalkia acidurici 9a]